MAQNQSLLLPGSVETEQIDSAVTTPSNALQCQHESSEVDLGLIDEWNILPRQRLQQKRWKKSRVLIKLEQSRGVEGALQCLKDEYTEQGLSEAFRYFTPVLDTVESFVAAITVMCQAGPGALMLIWGSLLFVLEVCFLLSNHST